MLASKYQDYMFGLIKKVIDEIGPRASCSEAEKKLGRLLVEEWKPICDRVDVEPFTCSPTAWISSIPLMALFALAAIILYWFLPPLALALAVVSCSIIFLEMVLSREFVDVLFPRKQGENVMGAIRPKGETTQRVIVSAHLDSAYEFNLCLYFKSAWLLPVKIGIVALVIVFGACLAKTIAYLNVFSNEAALTGVGIALIALSPIMALFLFFTSWKPVPGAGDDMSGVSVVAGLGRYLGEAKRSGEWFPERTEVVLLGTSSEEASLRGAKRYVRTHLEEMKAIRTYFLALDGFLEDNTVAVFTAELSTGAKHDPELVRMAQESAASHNWPIAARQAPPPSASDASPFSLSGIPATWLSFYDHSKVSPYEHTRHDTYEHISPESLSVMLQLVIDMIQRIDKK